MDSFVKTGEPRPKAKEGLFGRLSALFGRKSIDNLVDENFPSWEEYSTQKLTEEGDRSLEIPPHRVSITSPLNKNFIYLLAVTGMLGMGYAIPDWSPALIYSAIFAAFAIALVSILNDSIFFHLEAGRLEQDGEAINRHSWGPEQEKPKPGFWRRLFHRHKKRTIFHSRLMQIHYQNVVRTFEQGNRRAWVGQEASISDIMTLLTQRGMKVAWTLIEVLPQLGLIGTLIGLATMFLAFSTGAQVPEINLLSGFGTALGTTVIANIFVLILRPLYMQNERAVAELISTLQTLMAMFILPTQQEAISNQGATGMGVSTRRQAAAGMGPQGFGPDPRAFKVLEGLARSVEGLVATQQSVSGGDMAKETAKVAAEVQKSLAAFQEAFNPERLQQQERQLNRLADSVAELTQAVKELGKPAAGGPPPLTPKMEHDMLQLRVLTHDTLVMLEQLYQKLGLSHQKGDKVLTQEGTVREQVFEDVSGANIGHQQKRR